MATFAECDDMLAALPTLYYCEATGAFHVTNKGHEPMPQVLQLIVSRLVHPFILK